MGTRRITDCGVAAVTVVLVVVRIMCGLVSKRSSADYGLWDYGFVRIADCVRASRLQVG